MPKQLELKLKRQVADKPWDKKRKDAYVFGTMRKTGWVPSTQKTDAIKRRLGKT